MKKHVIRTTRGRSQAARGVAIDKRGSGRRSTGDRFLSGSTSRLVHQQKTKRVASSEIPTFIRASGTSINRTDRAYLRRKLGRRLGKFAPAVERVSVRIEDVNSLRGGIDKRCRIKVVLSGLSSVMIDQRHPVLQATMDRALRRLEMAVRRRVKRRQEHRGSSPTPAT